MESVLMQSLVLVLVLVLVLTGVGAAAADNRCFLSIISRDV